MPTTPDEKTPKNQEVEDNLWSDLIAAFQNASLQLQQTKDKKDPISNAFLQTLLTPIARISSRLFPSVIKADFWTNLQAVVEFLGSIENLFWISTIIDDIFPTEMCPYGNFSWWGLGFGAGFAFLLAFSEMQSHKIMNIINQENEPVILNASAEKSTLDWKQYLYLAGETINHTRENGGKFPLYLRLFGINNSWVKLGTYIIGTSLGLGGSVSETRTHYRSMLRYNSMFKNSSSLPQENEAYHRLEEGRSMPSSEPSSVVEPKQSPWQQGLIW